MRIADGRGNALYERQKALNLNWTQKYLEPNVSESFSSISGGSAAGVDVDNNIAMADRLATGHSFPARSMPLVPQTGLRMFECQP